MLSCYFTMVLLYLIIEMNTYLYLFLIGFIGKIYDDLQELYLVKHPRLLETIKTFWTIMIFYFMFTLATNAYDILFMLFVWTFLPLVDWYAFTDDPYLFSLTVSISLVGIGILFATPFTFHWTYFAVAFVFYILCSPITEFFCFELNGPIYDILSSLGILPPGADGHIFATLNEKELEVSPTKLTTRIISVTFLTCMILFVNYLRSFVPDTELYQVYTSVMYLSLVNVGYFVLSILNQINVLYFQSKKTDAVL